MAKKYIVKKGDSLWKIAKENNIELDELIRLNPTKQNMIHPNDILRLEPDKITKEINIRDERQRENRLSLQDITAIQGYRHDNNYIIIDKKNRQFSIYDKDNNLLYSTSNFATGKSGEDYNTITYADKNGNIINNKGNNSTPAGITEISGKGIYHGYPSFTRARTNSNGSKENIASSLHYGIIGEKRKASNGCVRIDGKTLCDIEPYVSVGTRIYTLPEKEGSRFSLKGGRLNFIADNPYGNDKGDKRFWDDYNVNIDKSYSPLKLKWKKTGNKDYDDNRKSYAQAIVNNKRELQKRFNLTSDEYNNLAELALGIAEQESKFGTADRYKLKSYVPDFALDLSKYVTRGHAGARSRGYTQIKIKGDNTGLQEIYKALNINEDNINNADKSAIATIARLAYMYNNEVKGRNFKTAKGNDLNPYHALMYKWLGKNNELRNQTATPNKNVYIRNVNQYSRNFDMYDMRTYDVYKYGGKFSLEDI